MKPSCSICIFTLLFSWLLLGPAEKLKATEIQFPAHELSRTPYNAQVLDIEPFTLHLSLPENWSVQLPDAAENAVHGFSPLYLVSGDARIGELDYNTFAVPADTTDANFYRAVYGQLMNSNHVTWDCEYKPVKQDAVSAAATCKIWSDLPDRDAPTLSPGILAYNTDLQVYVNLSFAPDAVSDETLEQIAKSITFTSNE